MRARHETSRSTVRKMKNVSDYKRTHTQTQTTYTSDKIQEHCRKRNQHAEMGTGPIFSFSVSCCSKSKGGKKGNARNERNRNIDMNGEKIVDASVVDATLASTFKMIKRGEGKTQKRKKMK